MFLLLIISKMNLADLRMLCINSMPECSHHFIAAIKCDKIYYNKIVGLYPRPLCIVLTSSFVYSDKTFAALPVGDISKNDLLLSVSIFILPSVGAGNLLHDFIQSKIIPTNTLTQPDFIQISLP